MWRQRTAEAGCSPVRSVLSVGKDLLRPPTHHLDLVCGWGGIFFFFSGSLPLQPTEDLRLGYNRGGGCRARGAPPPPHAAPRTPPWNPGRRSPLYPRGGSSGESPPFSGTAPRTRAGPAAGGCPGPQGLRGVRGAAAWGTGGNGSWEVAPGGARLSRDPALDACLGCDPLPLPPPREAVGCAAPPPKPPPWLPRGACWGWGCGGPLPP